MEVRGELIGPAGGGLRLCIHLTVSTVSALAVWASLSIRRGSEVMEAPPLRPATWGGGFFGTRSSRSSLELDIGLCLAKGLLPFGYEVLFVLQM